MQQPYHILIPLAASGHDPTEVAIPYAYFMNNPRRQCQVTFATADGATPQADSLMLEGWTGAILGASAEAKKAYRAMSTECQSWKQPIAWRSSDFDITQYDCVFLPGGHEKGVRTIIEDEVMHSHLQKFFPLTRRDRQLEPGQNKKMVGAICHGVQVLAFCAAIDSGLQQFPLEEFHSGKVAERNGKRFKSVIHSCRTTALPGFMESGIYSVTKLMLGDYYKTFGACTPTVEEYVRATLDDSNQFEVGPRWWQLAQMGNPFVVTDSKMRYISARYPPDAQKLAATMISESLNESPQVYKL